VDIEVGPILEANQGYRWQRVEIVYAYRPIGGIQRLSSELIELRAFDPADLPDVRADQRGIIERRAAQAAEWAKSRREGVSSPSSLFSRSSPGCLVRAPPPT